MRRCFYVLVLYYAKMVKQNKTRILSGLLGESFYCKVEEYMESRRAELYRILVVLLDGEKLEWELDPSRHTMDFDKDCTLYVLRDAGLIEELINHCWKLTNNGAVLAKWITG